MFQFPVGGGLYSTDCWVVESEVDNTSFYSVETNMFLCAVLPIPLYALVV